MVGMLITEETAKALAAELQHVARIVEAARPEQYTAQELRQIWPGSSISAIESAARRLIGYDGPPGKGMWLWKDQVDTLRGLMRAERLSGLASFRRG